jgi:signal transduction histidine kinase
VIIHNLLSNSLKYRHAERPAVIEISSESIPGGISLSIKDNGSGIDLDKYRDKLFGLNRKFDNRASGRGLGLFMVKTYVDMLGAAIEVKSIPGEGTTFTLKIKG